MNETTSEMFVGGCGMLFARGAERSSGEEKTLALLSFFSRHACTTVCMRVYVCMYVCMSMRCMYFGLPPLLLFRRRCLTVIGNRQQIWKWGDEEEEFFPPLFLSQEVQFYLPSSSSSLY